MVEIDVRHILASMVTTDGMKKPKNCFMLYLVCNFSSSNVRDVIYGLRGLNSFSNPAAAKLLEYRL